MLARVGLWPWESYWFFTVDDRNGRRVRADGWYVMTRSEADNYYVSLKERYWNEQVSIHQWRWSGSSWQQTL